MRLPALQCSSAVSVLLIWHITTT